jgi:hypothetical protein
MRSSSCAPRTSGGPGVFSNSSRMTATHLFFTAATFFHAGLRSAVAVLAFVPVAAQARTIISGFASATCSSVTRWPVGTTSVPPAIVTRSATHGGELMRGFGHASQYTLGRFASREFPALRRTRSKPIRISRISRPAAVPRFTTRPRIRMSDSISASERGLMARNATGCASNFATVSGAKGTEPITSVGSSFITSSTSNFQQSPTAGRRPTFATSLHQRLTPTSSRPAPNARRIEVTFGARETTRTWPLGFTRFTVLKYELRCRF